MLVHGFAFDDLLVSSIVTIPKGKTVLCSDSSNCRGIAFSSIFGKVFDRIVINRYYDVLASSALQLGFKNRHSTTMCTMVMKETLSYYAANKGISHSPAVLFFMRLISDQKSRVRFSMIIFANCSLTKLTSCFRTCRIA